MNEKVNLPREIRRRLRAVAHRMDQAQRPILDAGYQPFHYGRRAQPTLTPSQFQGWHALQSMIAQQARE